MLWHNDVSAKLQAMISFLADCKKLALLRLHVDQERFRRVFPYHELFAHHFPRLCNAGGIAKLHRGALRRDLGTKNERITFKRPGLDESSGKIVSENIKLIRFFPGVPGEDQQSFKVADGAL